MNKKNQRKEEIARLRSEGKTLQEIGDKYSITRERVRQILAQNYSRRRDLKLKYGISLEQYDEMLKAQGGKCKICGATPRKLRLSVDHDHRTNEVRGLLCGHCNTGIGNLRDSIMLLEKAIQYLEKYQTEAT